jgi:hypothetical protein
MKKNILGFFAVVGIGVSLVVLLTIVPSNHPVSIGILARAYAEEMGCGTQLLHGSYIYSADGFVAASPGEGPFTPISEAGVYIFNGDGQFSTTNTLSFGGLIFPRKAKGTYSVNSDCTGSVNIEEGVTFDFAISRWAKEMRFVVTTPTVSVSGTMTRQ